MWLAVRVVLLGALVAGASACRVNLAVDTQARITCRDEGDCPSKFTCRTTIGFCVVANDPNDRPPELAGAKWSRTVGRQGDDFVVTFTVSEPLLFAPDVRLADGGAAFELVAEGDPEYAFRLIAAPPLPEARELEVVAIATDQNGNVAQLSLGAIRFDFGAPRIYDVAWVLPAGLSAVNGTQPLALTAQIESGADLVSLHVIALPAQTVLADVSAAAIRVPHPTHDAFEAPVTLDPAALAGAQSIAIELVAVDAVGNATNPPHRGPSLPVDGDPPAIDAVLLDNGAVTTTSFLVIAHIAATGATAIFVDGDLANSPSVRVWLPFSNVAELPLFLSPLAGDKHITVLARDAAFNVSAVFPVDITLAPDTIPPSVDTFAITTPSPTQSLTVDLNIVASDNRNVIAGYLVRESSVAPTPSEVNVMPVPTSFTFTPGEGERSLWAWAKDPSDVRSGARPEAKVIIDQTPPGSIAFDYGQVVPSPPLYTNIASVPVTASAVDTNAMERFVIREDALTPALMDYQAVPPTMHTLFGGPSQGLHTLRLWARDFAGNYAQAASTLGVFFDNVAPAVTAFNVPVRPQTSPANSLVLTDSDLAPSSTVYRWRMTTDNAAPPTAAQMNLVARPTSVTFSAGLHTVYVWAMDQAGNISAALARSYAYQELPLGPTGQQNERDVALSANGNFVTCWTAADASSNGVSCQLLAGDGSAPGSPFLVNSGATSGDQSAPAVAIDALGRFAVAYCDKAAASGQQHKVRLYDALGAARTPILTLPFAGSCTGPDLAVFPSGYLYLGSDSVIRLDLDGVTVGSPLAGSGSGARIAARADGGYVVAYGDFGHVYFQQYTAAGATLGANGDLGPTPMDSNQFHDVAMDDAGNYVIAWSLVDNSSPFVSDQLSVACFTAGSVTPAPAPLTGGYAGSPTRLAKDPATGAFTATYMLSPATSVNVRHFDAACTPNGGSTVVTSTANGPANAVIARAGTSFVVAWHASDLSTHGRFYVAP
ncbi:MAG: hypothetical protein IT381_17760 [Deltaproteobacteria bacterium]|nr:hypothetical protein [Deltaproteobacteria bacterium]